MKLLAVDTSCDESCAAVLDTETWQLLGESVHSHVDAMAAYGGVVPEVASREHLRGLPIAVDQVLKQGKLTMKDIDWYAVTDRPGLIGALLVGVTYMKAAAFAADKPFSALNHIEAHLFSPLLASFEGKEVPPFPWIALVVSGGHTELFLVRDVSDFEWIGGTLDDAAGEAFDKIGKLLGLAYPAGPRIDRWVRETATDEDRNAYSFPIAKTDKWNFSFSGLKTAVATQIQKEKELSEQTKLRIAASSQEAIIKALTEKLSAASAHYDIPQIVVCGGVACNSRLRAALPNAYFPEPRHCTDNAAMVALLAGLREKKGMLHKSPWTQTPSPYLEL